MLAELVNISLPMPFGEQPRTEGVHLSGILRKLAILNGSLEIAEPENLDLIEVKGDNLRWWNNLPEDAQLRIAMGVAWEQWYIPRLEDVIDHPGEMCLEGIYLTPDGESISYIYSPLLSDEQDVFIHEVKLTYKSIRTVGDLTTQWLWIAQIRAYCKAKGTRYAFLHVLFVCGNYSFPIKPQRRVWRITFTDLELDDHWDIVVSYRDYCLTGVSDVSD